MVVLGGWAFSYGPGTPVGCNAAPPPTPRLVSEALGPLGQDEPASGMALEPLVAFAPVSGSVAIALHHRNSKGATERKLPFVGSQGYLAHEKTPPPRSLR